MTIFIATGQSILRAAILVLLLLNATGCKEKKSPIMASETSAPYVQGQVLEEDSRKPIADAIVIGRWQEAISIFPADSQTACVHVETATTDAQGGYRMRTWNGHEPTFIDSYTFGYVRSDEFYKTEKKMGKFVDKLERFKGTKEERLKKLVWTLSGTRCPSADKSYRNLYPMYKNIYEEGKSIAVAEEDWKTVKILRYEAARAAVKPDGNPTSDEMDRMINEFLKDNLK